MPRRFFFKLITAGLVVAPSYSAIHAFYLEPQWLKIKTLKPLASKPTHTLAHFTDIHHKGDAKYLERVVRTLNRLEVDFVCFTGDLIEHHAHLEEATRILNKIRHPVFGVPGNHDYWSNADLYDIGEFCRSTGGAWLEDEQTVTDDGKIEIVGTGKRVPDKLPALAEGRKRILLTHYPMDIKQLGNLTFDVILAGHSHGGQVRFPFKGSLIKPSRTGKYDRGLFDTIHGPLYVNPGIGTFYWDVRFACRPEITVIRI